MKTFNMARVDEAATFIAGELKALLDRHHYDSHVQRRLSEACPAYKNGLTNGETELAKLQALSMAQLAITAELGGLEYDVEVEEEEGVWKYIKVSDEEVSA